jgi:predicted methyltransferase MtxX (methanogen marker protein 4)
VSSTDRDEDMTPSLASQRAALVGLPLDDPVRQAADARVAEAWAELRVALYVVGIDLDAYVEDKLTLITLAQAFAWRWHCRCRFGSIAAEVAA